MRDRRDGGADESDGETEGGSDVGERECARACACACARCARVWTRECVRGCGQGFTATLETFVVAAMPALRDLLMCTGYPGLARRRLRVTQRCA